MKLNQKFVCVVRACVCVCGVCVCSVRASVCVCMCFRYGVGGNVLVSLHDSVYSEL